MATLNNPLNLTAETFDTEKFNEIVNNIRRTQKSILGADDTRTELEEKFSTAKANLQKAMDEGNFDDMQKYTAEAKRTMAKLEENPAIKVQDFDDAIKALAEFCTPREAAAVVDFDQVANG